MGKYTENFTKETVDQFIDCLDDAQANIRQYLLEQEATFDIDQCTDNSIQSLKKSIWDFYEEANDREKAEIKSMLDNIAGQDREVSFITFNYEKERTMGDKKIGPIRQVWYAVKQKIHAWNEWQDAKDWAREYHPAWVELATKARHEETRKAYRQKILLAYRGYEYV